MLIRFSADRRRTSSLLLPGFVILPLLATCLSREIHNESRYHFHMYPFILIGFAVAIDLAARAVAEGLDSLTAILGQSFRTKRLATGLLAVLFALAGSPDLAPGAIALFVSRDYTTPVDPIRSVLSWRPYATFHQDHEGPALHVRAELAPGDRVVVSGPTYWASIYDYYLGGRVNYAVTERPERLLKDGHVVHHVTGARCLTSPAELDSMLAAESGHRIWVLADSNLLGEPNRYFSSPMKAGAGRAARAAALPRTRSSTRVARMKVRRKALGVPPVSVAAAARRGIAWTISSNVANQAFPFGVGVILARLLSPADFGVFAVTGIFSGLAAVVSNIGLGSALVQRKEIEEAIGGRCWPIWSGRGPSCSCSPCLALGRPVFQQPDRRPVLVYGASTSSSTPRGRSRSRSCRRVCASAPWRTSRRSPRSRTERSRWCSP